MKRKNILLGVAAIPLLGAATSIYAAQPNVLLIQVDDLGFDDLGINGQKVTQTPNLDKLAESSVQFENYYAHQLSAPSRASLLTGRHFWRTGVTGVHAGRDNMNLDEKTMGQYFQDAGYITATWGKWHSGKSQGYFPWERGFNEAYMAELYLHNKPEGLLNGEPVKYKGKWSDEVCSDMAIEFLNNRKSDNKPFFAYLSYLAPHGPWMAPSEYIDKYMKMGHSKIYSTLCGQIDYLDSQIGRVLDHLNSSPLAENTIVIFVSDNGPVGHEGKTALTAVEWRLRNQNEARGAKATSWENGMHSPLFIKWGSKLPVGNNQHLVSVCDLLPTLMEACEITPKKYAKEIDGVSFVPILKDCRELTSEEYAASHPGIFLSNWTPLYEINIPEHMDNLPSTPYMQQSSPITAETRAGLRVEDQSFALIKGDYKLLVNHQKEEPLSLKNLRLDPKEQRNFASQHPEIVKQMHGELLEWYDDVYKNEDSFNMPIFVVGGLKVNTVFAFGPTFISENLYNEPHCLNGWLKKGDYSTYDIRVVEAGEYEVTVNIYHQSKNKDMQFEVSCGKERAKAVVNSTYGDKPKSINLKKGDTQLKLMLTDDIASRVKIREVLLTKVKK